MLQLMTPDPVHPVHPVPAGACPRIAVLLSKTYVFHKKITVLLSKTMFFIENSSFAQ